MSEIDELVFVAVMGVLLGAGIALHVLRMLALERVARATERLAPMIETAEHVKAVFNTGLWEFRELKTAQEILAFVSPTLRIPALRLLARKVQR